MTTVPLWVYKCNARNPPPGVVVADWEQFFREGRREWGSTQAIRSAVTFGDSSGGDGGGRSSARDPD